MNGTRMRIGGLVVVVGLVMIPTMAGAQDGAFDHGRKLGGKAGDFAAAKADAWARANNDARLKNTSTNKAQQSQSAKGVGLGGSSFADVTVKNHNSATTGPISNTNINTNFSENKLINNNTVKPSAAPVLRRVK